MQMSTNRELESRVEVALQRVKAVLDTTRTLVVPSALPHTYDDKYYLAELAIQMTLQCQLNMLASLGLDVEKLRCLLDWSHNARVVQIQFVSTETCSFDRTEAREQEDSTSFVTESTFLGTTHKTLTKTMHNYWQVESEWSLQVYASGYSTAEHKPLVLQTRKGCCMVETIGVNKAAPRPPKSIFGPIELDCSFLLMCIEPGKSASEPRAAFRINRNHTACHTPRRNGDCDRALEYLESMAMWTYNVGEALTSHVFARDPKHDLGAASVLAAGNDQVVFEPVLAMFSFERAEKAGDVARKSLCRTSEDMHAFLDEQKREILTQHAAMDEAFPSANDTTVLASAAEVNGLID
jgi:hypothetical protein